MPLMQVAIILATVIALGAGILVAYLGNPQLLLVAVLTILVAYVAVLGIIIATVSAATTVFKTAIYQYAMGNPAGPFTPDEMRSSFTTPG